MNKTVLVTGGLGYIGRVLARRLTASGYAVIIVDSDLFHDADHSLESITAEVRRMDIRDLKASDFESVDAVCHLAALSNDPLGNLNEDLTLEINHLAAVQCARLAREAGVGRFLFSSSCSSYGAAGDEMLDENAELCPVTPYGKSKVLAEHDIAALSDGSFCTVSLRNATAYGYSPRLRLDLVINDFCATAHHGGNLLIKSDGTPWRPLVHIDDISSAFIALLKADGATVNGQSYNVGSDDQNYRVSQIAELVAAQIDDCGIEYAAGGGPDKRCYRVSCKKLGRDVPEFVTKWDVGKGARELVDAFELHGLSTSDLTEERFIRLAGLARRQRAGEVDQRLRLVRQTSSQV